MNKFCNKCGAEVSADSKFCSECGSQINITEVIEKKDSIQNLVNQLRQREIELSKLNKDNRFQTSIGTPNNDTPTKKTSEKKVEQPTNTKRKIKHIGFYIWWLFLSVFSFMGHDTKSGYDLLMSILAGFIVTGIGYFIAILFKESPTTSNNASTTYTYHAKPLSNKKQYKANKKAGIVSCPKCGSTSITTSNKKISAGKGVAGGVVGNIVMPGVGTVVGAAVGATHSKKIYNVCMNCGHKWKP